MQVNHFVLWIKDNQTIRSYQEKYYNKLLEILKQLESKLNKNIFDRLVDPANKDLLMYPDVSWCINYIFSWMWNFEDNIKKLEKAIEHKPELIPGTDIALTLEDYNPYNMFDTHPDHSKHGACISWWELSKQQWMDTYASVFNTLKIADQDMFDEVNFLLKKIVPFSTHKYLHNSASYKECIWTVYLWYLMNENPEYGILEWLIHEYSHNKLNIVMQSEVLVLNDKSEIYYSPYRPDARHIHGIYLWLHAFAPTINILLKSYKAGIIKSDQWLEKILLYHLKNKYSYIVLKKYGNFSTIWQEILDEMVYVNKLTDTEISSMNINEFINQNVRNKFKSHLSDVIKNYPNLRY